LANVLAMGRRGGFRHPASSSSANSPNTRRGLWTSRARWRAHRRPVSKKREESLWMTWRERIARPGEAGDGIGKRERGYDWLNTN
jgi:hypothetical protein